MTVKCITMTVTNRKHDVRRTLRRFGWERIPLQRLHQQMGPIARQGEADPRVELRLRLFSCHRAPRP
jgi:hypothetical protein